MVKQTKRTKLIIVFDINKKYKILNYEFEVTPLEQEVERFIIMEEYNRVVRPNFSTEYYGARHCEIDFENNFIWKPKLIYV